MPFALGGSEIQRWMPPDVALDSATPPQPEGGTLSPEELAAITETARQTGAEAGFRAGYQTGYQEGLELAAREAAAERQERERREQEWRAHEESTLRATVGSLVGIAREFADPLANSADALEPELLALVSALARRVVLAELATRPELIEQVLQSALGQLPSRNHGVRVEVHPDDQRILEIYASAHGETVTWIANPDLEPGGCILVSGPSRIDASLEVRLRQGIEAIWGELTRPEPEPEPELSPVLVETSPVFEPRAEVDQEDQDQDGDEPSGLIESPTEVSVPSEEEAAESLASHREIPTTSPVEPGS
ncbi:hypothetical protein CKO27_03390 [Thiocystis violacea]|nr:hypothetical protein [Thiocystis violacea]